MSTLWQDIKTEFIHTNSIVTRIIFINVVIFILTYFVGTILYLGQVPYDQNIIREYAGVSSNIHTVLIRPWTVITYGFIHDGLLHIFFNMLMLYWFGRIFTEFLGNKKFLPVYLLGIIAGALLFIIMYNIAPVFKVGIEGSMVGASAGVLAIAVAAATLLPDYTVFLILIGPVKLKWLALVLVLIDLVSIPFGNAGGHIAHLGGALLGFTYIRQLRRGNDIGRGLTSFFDWMVTLFSDRKKIRVVSSNTSSYTAPKKTEAVDTQHQERLDRILDKISHSGYESLSKEEKDFLFNYSKKGN